MIKFKYLHQTFPPHAESATFTNYIKWLNELGEQGWELIYRTSQDDCIFKKRV